MSRQTRRPIAADAESRPDCASHGLVCPPRTAAPASRPLARRAAAVGRGTAPHVVTPRRLASLFARAISSSLGTTAAKGGRSEGRSDQQS